MIPGRGPAWVAAPESLSAPFPDPTPTMTRLPTTLSAAAVLALLSTPLAVGAQESTTRGLNLGLHASGASLAVEDEDRNQAGGGGLRIGYGLNRSFMVLVQVDGARFDEQSSGQVDGDWTLGHVEAGVRYHFANSLRSWVPYLQAGLGYRVVGVEDPEVEGRQVDEAELSGSSLSLGGGVAFHLAPSVALDLEVLWSGGEFSTLRVENVEVSGFDLDASSTRVNLGVSWWP